MVFIGFGIFGNEQTTQRVCVPTHRQSSVQIQCSVVFDGFSTRFLFYAKQNRKKSIYFFSPYHARTSLPRHRQTQEKKACLFDGQFPASVPAGSADHTQSVRCLWPTNQPWTLTIELWTGGHHKVSVCQRTHVSTAYDATKVREENTRGLPSRREKQGSQR